MLTLKRDSKNTDDFLRRGQPIHQRRETQLSLEAAPIGGLLFVLGTPRVIKGPSSCSLLHALRAY